MTDEPKTNAELAESMGIVKHGYTFSMSAEALADNTPKFYFDPFRKRKVKSQSWFVPDPEVVAAFKEWEARYDAIRREGFEKEFLQSGYDGDWTEQPEPHWEYKYEYEEER